MKTRNDFVSNSSSSSFIVLHSDNKHGILLDMSMAEDRKMHKFTLKEYLHHFWRREFLPYEYGWNHDSVNGKIQFVTDQKFAKLFAEDRCTYSLPESAKDIWGELVKARDRREQHEKELYDSKDFKNDNIIEMLNTEDKLFDMILDKVETALKDMFGEETFDYIEVSDCYDESYADDPDCDYEDEVGKVQARIAYVRSLAKPKFTARVFNNH